MTSFIFTLSGCGILQFSFKACRGRPSKANQDDGEQITTFIGKLDHEARHLALSSFIINRIHTCRSDLNNAAALARFSLWLWQIISNSKNFRGTKLFKNYTFHSGCFQIRTIPRIIDNKIGASQGWQRNNEIVTQFVSAAGFHFNFFPKLFLFPINGAFYFTRDGDLRIIHIDKQSTLLITTIKQTNEEKK